VLDVLSVLCLLAMLAIAMTAGVKYRRTRDIGFLWLGLALVVWPLAEGLLVSWQRPAFERLVSGESVGYFPFSLVKAGKMTPGELVVTLRYCYRLIGLTLGLLAVAFLHRRKQSAHARPDAPAS
jgi:hypothetical protein